MATRPSAELTRQLSDLVDSMPVGTTAEDPTFVKWKARAAAAIETFYGPASRQVTEFLSISWESNVDTADRTRNQYHQREAYARAAAKARALLEGSADAARGFQASDSVSDMTATGNKAQAKTTLTKPALFIGSSVEGLRAAYAIQANLEHVAEVTVWSQGVFKLTGNTLADLLRALTSFDFAVFVFTPDDVLIMRDRESGAVRDNVIFEMGMFLGRFSTSRVFYVLPRNNEPFHLPTDLLGVNPGTYQPDRADNNLRAALGPFCNEVQEAIVTRGKRKRGR